MGKNGRKAAVGRFNWESESKVLFSVYERVLNGNAHDLH